MSSFLDLLDTCAVQLIKVAINDTKSTFFTMSVSRSRSSVPMRVSLYQKNIINGVWIFVWSRDFSTRVLQKQENSVWYEIRGEQCHKYLSRTFQGRVLVPPWRTGNGEPLALLVEFCESFVMWCGRGVQCCQGLSIDAFWWLCRSGKSMAHKL